MKRQKLRKAIIIISFILFPATFYYFSPALIIESAAKGIVNGSFILFACLFLSALIFGRGFCGWVCPGGGLQEIISQARDKRIKASWSNWLKYIIWIPWISTIVFFAMKAGGYKEVRPFFQTWYGFSMSDPHIIIIYLFIIMLIALPAFIFGKRSFCHSLCWMAPFMVIGRKIRNMLRIPSLHLQSDKDKCISCKTCITNCPMSLEVNKMVQTQKIENSECILCGTCIDGCKQKAISYSFNTSYK